MPTDGETLLRVFFDRFNAGDVEGQLAMISPDYDWHPAYTGGGLVDHSTYRGKDGFRKYLAELHEAWSEISLTIVEVRRFDERLLVSARINAVGRASRVPVEQRFAGIWLIRSREFISGHAYETLEEALDALPIQQGQGTR